MTSKVTTAKKKASMPLGLRLTRAGFALYGAVAPRRAGRKAELLFRAPVRRKRPVKRSGTSTRSSPKCARAAASATNPTPIAADRELTTRTAWPNSRAASAAEL